MNTSGRLLLAFATKQPPMSSTLHGGGKRPVTNLFDLPDSSQRCRSVPFPGLDLVRIIDSRWLARGEPLLAVWLDPHVSSLELRRGSGFGAQGSPKRW